MTHSMHNYEQVRDVLDYGIDLHVALRELYYRLGEQSDQTRVKMLLDYLSRHERNREAALQQFEEGSRKSILDAWLQYAPSSTIEQMLKDRVIRPDMNVDDVIKIAMAFDDALITLYREAAREIDDPHAREVLQNLAEMEHKEKQRFVRDAEWLEDI